ncbi:MAG: DUF4189 domain-containing protein [Shimia sp.]|nr:DUF4189 domain-containing protein [Shimia sp.]
MRIIKPFVLVAMYFAATSATAGECGYEYCWGAVGIGPDGAWAYSYGQYSEAEARNVVQSECGGNCDVVEAFYNTCGALSEGTDGNWGFGWAETRELAEGTSLDYCDDYGTGCRVRVWACSY